MRGPDSVRPFLKWAGGKYRLIDTITARLPEGRRLVEPFVGSGALFLNSHYQRYLLCDSNPDLIGLYKTLKQEGARFIHDCRPLFEPQYNNPTSFYALRDEFNQCDDTRRRSQLFLYLNRHGYNGLCRYNKSGEFNVPFGAYARPYFPEREMTHFQHKARHATFAVRDFEKTLAGCRAGDVVYCDPPYVPLSLSSNFTAYSQGGFNERQQRRLAELALRCARRGVQVLISNHDTRFTRELYCEANITTLQVQRNISCNGTARGQVQELLALFSKLREGS